MIEFKELDQLKREEEYILNTIGNSSIPWRDLLPLTVTYSVFLIVGILGNVTTCIVILRYEYMKTATNLYLLNLALADIASLIIGLIDCLKLC